MNSCPGIGPKCVSTTKRCAIPGRLPRDREILRFCILSSDSWKRWLVEPALRGRDHPFRHVFPAVTARRFLRQRQPCALTLRVIEGKPRYQLGGDLLHGSRSDFEREERP